MGRRKKDTGEIDYNALLAECESRIKEKEACDELRQDFDEYSVETNLFRQFPYAKGGCLPVGFHILWCMYSKHHTHDKPYTKSIKVAGEVAAFHPHGDCYGSMVRLSQNFVYPIPYLDGHGAFGSVTGGPTPASSRYTETRLTEFIEDVLFYNTKLLDMGLNYLEDEPEPIMRNWVALLPLLYISNFSQMGTAIRNTWTSGNLFEFREQVELYLKTGKVDCSKIYPDFPTGGIIINKSEMQKLYETGKGSIKVRGKAEIDGNVIKVYSLAYGGFKDKFKEDVKKLIENDKNPLKGIVDVRDKCDRNGFLFEIECEDNTAEYILEVLYRKTCLQANISDEHRAVVDGNKPELLNFAQYMRIFVEENLKLVKKEATICINDLNLRLELLDGLLSALDIIDEIIALIKKSKSKADAKTTLTTTKIKGHIFTERQAEAIVNTQLGTLANLEQIKLKEEKEKKEKERDFWQNILDNDKACKKYFFKRFSALVDKYGWERRTELTDIEMKDIRTVVKKPRALKAKKDYKVVLTSTNCLKRIEIGKFRATEEDEKNITVQGNAEVTLVTNKGNMFKVFSNKIDICMPSASGMPIKDIRPEIGDETVIAIYSEDVIIPYISFVTKMGLGKKCTIDSTLKLRRFSGTPICNLKPADDEIVAVKLLEENEKLEITTNKRKEVVDVKVKGKTANGSKLLALAKGEEILEVHSVLG